MPGGAPPPNFLFLNRVRKHHQVFFQSDILGAGEGSVDKRYLTKQPGGEWCPSMKFPCEAVVETEMGLWHLVIAQIVSPAKASLGIFKADGHGHKLWEW